ncbi:hypothetical protein POVCU2_0033390 [Plasmodium ovale curtisi]|uniref:Uncharacterized protein n=1 Tax=Plasmodium ovale curtisi TaxID=864141 RepID=A0A1A8WT17_PLAOA|nr:hypothetical protein POVCU2_0033390 [Plasmodium ovale curtisi]SBS96039.1 hypothetical protein POVCU1_030570 [Plasmodium ovale curtisi]
MLGSAWKKGKMYKDRRGHGSAEEENVSKNMMKRKDVHPQIQIDGYMLFSRKKGTIQYHMIDITAVMLIFFHSE